MGKKPRGVTSDLKVTRQWGVVVRQLMDATGVLKVHLVETKKYAYRLHLMRAMAPEWVLEALKEMNEDDNVGFEEENIMLNDDLSMTSVKDVEVSERELDSDEIDGIYLLGGDDKENEIMQSIELVEHNDAFDESLLWKQSKTMKIFKLKMRRLGLAMKKFSMLMEEITRTVKRKW